MHKYIDISTKTDEQIHPYTYTHILIYFHNHVHVVGHSRMITVMQRYNGTYIDNTYVPMHEYT